MRVPRSLLVDMCVLAMVLVLVSPAMAQKAGGKQEVSPLVTDRDRLPLSDKFGAFFGVPRVTPSGDVFFNSLSSLFFWDSATGTRIRLLQGGDPHPGFPGSVLDTAGGNLQVNAGGHAAMTNSFTQKGVRGPRGIFVYDGANFLKVAMRNEVAPAPAGRYS